MPKPPSSTERDLRPVVAATPDEALLQRYVPPAILVDSHLKPLRGLGELGDALREGAAGELAFGFPQRVLGALQGALLEALSTGLSVGGPMHVLRSPLARAVRIVVVPLVQYGQAWLCLEPTDEGVYDPLTELPNLRLFREHLKTAVRRAERHKGGLTVLHVDLGRLHTLNEEFGRGAGDELLQKVGQRLQSELRSADVLARIGGEDFGVVLEDVGLEQDATRVCHKLIAALTRPFQLGERELYCGGSIGAAIYPDAAATDDALLSAAVRALQEAQLLGRNRYAFAKPVA